MGHQPFEVTKILSIRRDNFSTYIKKKKKMKMSLPTDPIKVLAYFNNIVCPTKAKQLRLFPIARSTCHLAVQIDGHNLNATASVVGCVGYS